MNEYIFPFDTCEKINNTYIAQPYSVFFNILICLTITYYFIKAKTQHSKLFLLALLLFESFHTFSHITHIKGTLQINIIHVLAYLTNISFLYLFIKYTNKLPHNNYILFLLFIVCIDIYFLLYKSFLYYFGSMSILFISLLIYYYKYFTPSKQNNIKKIIYIIIFIIFLFINEKNNCKKMLKKFPNFPFHIFIEFSGLVLFNILCNTFYDM
jgi:hypothetical protein